MVVSGLINNSIILVGAVKVKEEVLNEEGDNTTQMEEKEATDTSTGEITAVPTEKAETETEEETTKSTDTEANTEAATNTSTSSEKVIVQDNTAMEGDASMEVNAGTEAGTLVDPTMQNGIPGGKDSLLTSWPFVGGVSLAVMIVSITIGAFLARRKIKKGIEIYED